MTPPLRTAGLTPPAPTAGHAARAPTPGRATRASTPGRATRSSTAGLVSPPLLRGGAMLRRARGLALALAAALLAACAGPPSHLTRIWPEGATDDPVLGLSTEDGVVVLAEPQWQVGDLFELHFPVGNSHVRDWGRLDRRNDDLAVIRPITARLLEGRFATALPEPHETVYLAMRDDQDEPVMEPVERWYGFRYGSFILPPWGTAEELVSQWAGVGLYVKRGDHWEIVGMLADISARLGTNPNAVAAAGFVGIGEMSRLLPDQVEYFNHPTLRPRPDFEHGVPLQPGDIVLDPDADAGAEASP